MEHPNPVLSLEEIICGYRILEVLWLGFLLDWVGIILKTRHKWSHCVLDVNMCNWCLKRCFQ